MHEEVAQEEGGVGTKEDASKLLQQKNPNDLQSCPKERCIQPGGLKYIILGCVIFALGVTVALVVDIYTGEHEVSGVEGVIASSSVVCSEIGKDMLKQGGAAIDAAIATMLCVDVTCLSSTGIGGGGFMLLQTPEGDVKVVDFREVAPGAATKNMFAKNKNATKYGGLSVGVPGQLRGFEIAHKKYGKLKWSELFQPSIKLARNGFKICSMDKKYLGYHNISMYLSDEFKNFFKNESDVRQPLLADTLERIAEEGADVFYNGHIAKSMIDAIAKDNGTMTLEDLKNYKAKIREAVTTEYHGYRVFTAGPPAGGLVLLSALNILEGFNLTRENISQPLTYHYLVETLKFVYAQRTRLADPDFVDVDNITKIMLSKESAAEIRKRIDKTKTFNNASHYGPFLESPQDYGTSHVSVIDGRGGVVTMTSSLNNPFGSKVYTSTGILLNNHMDDFATSESANYFELKPSSANIIEPGKRPMSSMTPAIALLKSDLCGHQIVLGASGGSRITTSVLQVLINLISYELPLRAAVQWPRLHHQLSPMVLDIEGRRVEIRIKKGLIEKDIFEFLKAKGNKLNTLPLFRSSVNVVVKNGDNITGFADERRKSGGIALF